MHNKPYSKDSVARSIVEIIVFENLELSMSQSIKKSRENLQKLSYEDIEKLSTYISEGIHRQEMPGEATLIWLKNNKGIEILS